MAFGHANLIMHFNVHMYVVCSGTYDAIFCWQTFQLKYCLGIYLIVLAVLYADKYSNIEWLIGATLAPHYV